MGSNKEVPGAISVRKAASLIRVGESTIIRIGRSIQPPIETKQGRIVLSELPRLRQELQEKLGRELPDFPDSH